LAGIVAGNVVVVVVVGSVVVVPGSVVVVVPGIVVVVVVVEVEVVVVECAMSGVTNTKDATSTALSERTIRRPRRNSLRGDNFTHLPYFVSRAELVTGSLQSAPAQYASSRSTPRTTKDQRDR
jgi:hypothetical protein